MNVKLRDSFVVSPAAETASLEDLFPNVHIARKQSFPHLFSIGPAEPLI
jgi:hypothetical protein